MPTESDELEADCSTQVKEDNGYSKEKEYSGLDVTSEDKMSPPVSAQESPDAAAACIQPPDADSVIKQITMKVVELELSDKDCSSSSSPEVKAVEDEDEKLSGDMEKLALEQSSHLINRGPTHGRAASWSTAPHTSHISMKNIPAYYQNCLAQNYSQPAYEQQLYTGGKQKRMHDGYNIPPPKFTKPPVENIDESIAVPYNMDSQQQVNFLQNFNNFALKDNYTKSMTVSNKACSGGSVVLKTPSPEVTSKMPSYPFTNGKLMNSGEITPDFDADAILNSLAYKYVGDQYAQTRDYDSDGYGSASPSSISTLSPESNHGSPLPSGNVPSPESDYGTLSPSSVHSDMTEQGQKSVYSMVEEDTILSSLQYSGLEITDNSLLSSASNKSIMHSEDVNMQQRKPNVEKEIHCEFLDNHLPEFCDVLTVIGEDLKQSQKPQNTNLLKQNSVQHNMMTKQSFTPGFLSAAVSIDGLPSQMMHHSVKNSLPVEDASVQTSSMKNSPPETSSAQNQPVCVPLPQNIPVCVSLVQNSPAASSTQNAPVVPSTQGVQAGRSSAHKVSVQVSSSPVIVLPPTTVAKAGCKGRPPITTSQPIFLLPMSNPNSSNSNQMQPPTIYVISPSQPQVKKNFTPILPKLPAANTKQQPGSGPKSSEAENKTKTSAKGAVVAHSYQNGGIKDTSPNIGFTGPQDSRKMLILARRCVANMTKQDLLFRDEDGDTYLHVAVCKTDVYMVQALLERQEREGLKNMIDVTNNLRQTPLYLAVAANQPAMVCMLIKFGANVNTLAEMDSSILYGDHKLVRAPIHCAASQGRTFALTLKQLFQAPDINLNLANSDGLTALHCAILEHGKTLPNGNKIDSTPIVSMLIKANADPNAQDKRNGKTPLMYAIEMKDYSLVDTILKFVDTSKIRSLIKTQTFDGITSLKIAEGMRIEYDSITWHKLMQLLTTAGCDGAKSYGHH